MRASIISTGMVTSVGFDAPSSCAAIRAGIPGFVETRFMFDEEWMIGSPVPFEEGWRGRERLLRLVVPAIEECLMGVAPSWDEEICLLLCIAEPDRPGRFPTLDESLLMEVQERVRRRFHRESCLIARGRIGGAHAVDHARRLIASGCRYCIVAGVDTYLVSTTLLSFVEQGRVHTALNSDGFIPGEAAAAVLLGSADSAMPPFLTCLAVGYGTEPAPIGSGLPLRADGLVAAYKNALAQASMTMDDLDFRITDLSGEQYGFREAALALTRALRTNKEEFQIWHPAECIGEVGAATAPALLAVAAAAARKGYAPGPGALCQLSADDGQRAALVLVADEGG